MLRSLHTKLVMIMVLLILSLMTVVGAFLVNSVTAFYLEEFYTQMADVFGDQSLIADLTTQTEAEMTGEADGAQMLESILNVYAGELGVDGRNRKLYILDRNGVCLIYPDGETGQLNYSNNLTFALTTGLETMEAGDESSVAEDYMDVAIPIQRGEETYIIYILDNKATANNLTGQMFMLIAEALVFGLAAGAAGTLVVRVVSVLFSTIVNLALYRYAGAIPSLLVGLVGLVFWLAVCLGGVWGILYLMKEAPAFEHLLEDPAGKFAILMDALKKGAGDVQQQASAAAASAKSAYDAHQAQQAQAAQAMQAQAQAAQAQGAGTNGAAYPAVRIQTNRSLAAYILFSIITCGIYSYYFIYTVARDVNTMCREDGEKTGGLLAFILLSMVTCGLYGLYWEYKLGNRLAANAPRYGLNFQENGTTVLMWYLVGLLLCFIGPWVAMHILIKNTNALAAAYNARNGL